MNIRKTPAPVLRVAAVVVLLVPIGFAQNAIQLFNPQVDQTSTVSFGTYISEGHTTANVTCPSSGFTAVLSSTSDGTGNVFEDNFINLTVGTNAPVNVCTGGYQDGEGGSLDQTGTTTVSGQSDCFNSSYVSVAGVSSPSGVLGTNPDPRTYGVAPVSIASYLSSGLNQVQFDLVDFGGEFGNSPIYLVTSCTASVTSQTQTQTATPGATTTFAYVDGTSAAITPSSSANPDTLPITDFIVAPFTVHNPSGDPATFAGAQCIPDVNNECHIYGIQCISGGTTNDCDTIASTEAFSFPSSQNNVFAGGLLKAPLSQSLTGPECSRDSFNNSVTTDQFTGIATADITITGKSSPPGGYSCWMATKRTPFQWFPLYDESHPYKRGSNIWILGILYDPNTLADLSSPNIVLQPVSLALSGTTTTAPTPGDFEFAFGTYVLEIAAPTTPGTWVLTFQGTLNGNPLFVQRQTLFVVK